MPDTTTVTESPVPEPTRRRGRTKILVGVLAVALVVGGLAAWRWWSQPKAFYDLGDSYSALPLPVADAALSSTVVFPKYEGSHEVITIRGLDAEFSKNTAAAKATFWVCHMASGEVPFMSVHNPESTCSDVEPFDPPMRFDHGVMPDSDYLFVMITPTRPGVTQLESVEIDYQRSARHLFQRGTQTIGVDRNITVR